MTATSGELQRLHCPRCGGVMMHGYSAGHWIRLRWTLRAKTRTVFAGTPLRRGRDWLNAPTLEAVRCEQCRIGVFRYGY